jgi:lipopolysaccharide biosynthesis protein
MQNSLRQLYEEHKGKVSDSWSLYIDEGDRIFAPYRDKSISLLEIGIQNGGSLEIWGKYFPEARKIVGCDIDPVCARLRFTDPRIAVVVGDANTDRCHQNIVLQAPNYDIVIDDGSHRSGDIVRSFARYFPILNDGGIYIAEDLHCSYWDSYQGGLHNPISAISFFKRLADIINYEHWRNGKARISLLAKFAEEFGTAFDESSLAGLHAIEFVNSLCVLRKLPPAGNALGRRRIAGTGQAVSQGLLKNNGITIHDLPMVTPNDDHWDVFQLKRTLDSFMKAPSSGDPILRDPSQPTADLEQKIVVMADFYMEQLNEKDRQIRKHRESVQKYQAGIAQYAAKTRNQEAEIQALNFQILRICSGLSWRLVHGLRMIRARLFPEGSRREKVWLIAKSAIHSGMGMDAAGFVRGIKRKLGGREKHVDRGAAKRESQKSRDAAAVPVAPLKPVPTKGKASAAYTGLWALSDSPANQEYIPLATARVVPDALPIKLIAFYHPLYHPTPETDKWWGKGFSDWIPVVKSAPQYIGQYQPRLPGELGFYDLRIPEMQRRQVELARQYGIHGFCFFYYFFNGQRLFHRPIEQFTSDPQIDFPFCLCWANESWIRRRGDRENDILIDQQYSHESDHRFIRDIIPLLRHKNYIRVDGRPLLAVSRPDLLPDPTGTARLWKEDCREAGLEMPYLVASQTSGFIDPSTFGFDAAVEFPPSKADLQNIHYTVQPINPDFHGSVFRYTDFLDDMNVQHPPLYRRFKTVLPGWDNTPRQSDHAYSFAFSSPNNYQQWLIRAGQSAMREQDPDMRLVFLNAWNAWADGAYLEPDQRFGYAFLQAGADSLKALATGIDRDHAPLNRMVHFEPSVRHSDTAVILHLFYPEMWEEILTFLENLNNDFDLFISVPRSVKINPDIILRRYPEAHIYRGENRGRDIAPFLILLGAIYPLRYKYICKIHTKHSPHRADGDAWRKDLFAKLLGSPSGVQSLKRVLDDNADVGLIIPQAHVLSSKKYMGKSTPQIRRLARLAGIENADQEFKFGAGSMFWFRPEIFFPLVLLPLGLEDFEIEQGQLDGTMAHAFERMFGLGARSMGYRLLEINSDGLIQELAPDAGSQYAFAPSAGSGIKADGMDRSPIFVFQMGKVGSISMMESLKQAYQDLFVNIPIYHVHVLDNLDGIERELWKHRKYPVGAMGTIEHGRKLRKMIDLNPYSHWRIISLVRDPVARNVGTFFHNLSDFIPDWRMRHAAGQLDMAFLKKMFLEAETLHDAPGEWFENQLQPVFGIDVFANSFPRETGYAIYRNDPDSDLLVIRLEDLDRCARDAMREFLGLEGFEIIKRNMGDEKEYGDIYKSFKKILLPKEYVERMYATPYARHFYSAEEIDTFYRKWTGLDRHSENAAG